jgi:hypothetical protein
MSIVENINERTKRIMMINLTNLEAMAILKDEKVSEYMIKLQECQQKYSEDDNSFFGCSISKLCPEETESLVKCQKENEENINLCAPILYHLDDCMKAYSDKTLNLLSKINNY